MPLYSFGSNSASQLSLSHTNDVSIPTSCLFDPSSAPPPPIPPQSIVAGGNHTLLLFPSGEVYVTGANSSGQCALPHTEVGTQIPCFRRLPNPPPLHNGNSGAYDISLKWGFLAAGWEFSVLATADGKRVFSCGAGSRGELGLGSHIISTLGLDIPPIPGTTLHMIPNFPPTNTHITSLACSITHVIVVLNTSAVYGWGSSRKGQLSPPSLGAQPQPLKVAHSPTLISPLPFPVARAACTQETTFLISATGDQHILLGSQSPKWGLRENSPPQGALIGFRKIESAWNGIYILMGDGSVIAWGRGERGQLPESLTAVDILAIGSEHGVAVLRTGEEAEGRLVAWGWGEHGNCGKLERGGNDVASLRDVEVPRQGKRKRIKCVGAGCATSWVWVDWE